MTVHVRRSCNNIFLKLLLKNFVLKKIYHKPIHHWDRSTTCMWYLFEWTNIDVEYLLQLLFMNILHDIHTYIHTYSIFNQTFNLILLINYGINHTVLTISSNHMKLIQHEYIITYPVINAYYIFYICRNVPKFNKYIL